MNIKTCFLLPVIALFSSKSHALDWFVEPDFAFSERYTDNLRMLTTPTRDNLISTLSPNLQMGYIADDNELITDLKLNQLLYYGESALDFSEKIANLTHMYQAEHWKTDLEARYGEESSLSTQLNVNGSGNLNFQVPRYTKSISPGFTYQLTEKNSLQLNYNYVDVTFGRQSISNLGFSDYINQQVSATAIHNYSQRLSFNLNGGYSIYDSSNSLSTGAYKQNSTTTTYQLGLQYAFSEQMTFSANAGIRTSDTQSTIGNISQSSTNSGKIYSASLKRNFEAGDISLSANQQLNPASTGSQQQTTSISAIGNYDLTERWTTGINASYLKSQSIQGVGNIVTSTASYNRDYIYFSPNVKWLWTPDIRLEFSYNYQESDYTSLHQTARADTVQFQFVYQPKPNRQVK